MNSKGTGTIARHFLKRRYLRGLVKGLLHLHYPQTIAHISLYQRETRNSPLLVFEIMYVAACRHHLLMTLIFRRAVKSG